MIAFELPSFISMIYHILLVRSSYQSRPPPPAGLPFKPSIPPAHHSYLPLVLLDKICFLPFLPHPSQPIIQTSQETDPSCYVPLLKICNSSHNQPANQVQRNVKRASINTSKRLPIDIPLYPPLKVSGEKSSNRLLAAKLRMKFFLKLVKVVE